MASTYQKEAAWKVDQHRRWKRVKLRGCCKFSEFRNPSRTGEVEVGRVELDLKCFQEIERD